MSKITFNKISTPENVSLINDNFQKIANELNDKVLYRNTPITEPNQMYNNLDMNQYRIYNLPSPIAEHEPVTLQYLKDTQVRGQYEKTLRTNEFIPVLPDAAERAGKLLSFDAEGNPVATLISEDSATQLRIDLEASGGAELVTGVPAFLRNYEDIRSYTGKKSVIILTEEYCAGTFSVTGPFEEDNGGTCIVDAKGRAWKRQYEGSVLVDWFGNTTADWQRALNMAGSVSFGIGKTYNTEAILRIPSYTTVIIPQGTIIRRGLAGMSAIFVNDSDGTVGGYGANSNITITGGGVIDGNAAYSANPCTLIGFGHASNVVVENLTLANVGHRWHHVELNAVNFGVVRNCIIHTNGLPFDIAGEAIQIDSMGHPDWFPWFGPYDGRGCTDILIENNTFEAVGTCVGTHSVAGSGFESLHTRITIQNNMMNFFKAGVVPLNWSDVTIKDNRMVSNYSLSLIGYNYPIAGIYAVGNGYRSNSDFEISGNTIYMNERVTESSPSEACRGIWFYCPTDIRNNLRAINISNNRFYSCVDHCLVMSGVCSGTISGNWFSGAGNAISVEKMTIYLHGSEGFAVIGNILSNTATKGSIKIHGLGLNINLSNTVTNNYSIMLVSEGFTVATQLKGVYSGNTVKSSSNKIPDQNTASCYVGNNVVVG